MSTKLFCSIKSYVIEFEDNSYVLIEELNRVFGNSIQIIKEAGGEVDQDLEDAIINKFIDDVQSNKVNDIIKKG